MVCIMSGVIIDYIMFGMVMDWSLLYDVWETYWLNILCLEWLWIVLFLFNFFSIFILFFHVRYINLFSCIIFDFLCLIVYRCLLLNVLFLMGFLTWCLLLKELSGQSTWVESIRTLIRNSISHIIFVIHNLFSNTTTNSISNIKAN